MKALLLSLALAVAGCGPAANQNADTVAAPGTFLITAEQIEKSGANTAWQVLKQRAPMLTMREDRNGRPQSMGRRGRSSFMLDEAPMVLLDRVAGAETTGPDAHEARRSERAAPEHGPPRPLQLHARRSADGPARRRARPRFPCAGRDRCTIDPHHPDLRRRGRHDVLRHQRREWRDRDQDEGRKPVLARRGGSSIAPSPPAPLLPQETTDFDRGRPRSWGSASP